MLFALSKIFWALANPGNLLVVGLLTGAIAVRLPWRRARVLGKWLVAFVAGTAVAVAVLPLGAWLMAPLENRFPALAEAPARADGVIVLGGAINLPVSADRGIPSLSALADRMTTFVALARQYPEAKLVFSGGSSSLLNQVHREADYAEPLFESLGLASGRVLFDRASRNTRENAVNSAALARPRPDEVWLLVTSASHMPRAVGAFRRIGWPVIPVPVDYVTGARDLGGLNFAFLRGMSLLSLASHEWIGLAAYRLLDWTDAFFPGPAAAQVAAELREP
jgi:uncharacterized SAM-binding protein YcdF (DUF218 family)